MKATADLILRNGLISTLDPGNARSRHDQGQGSDERHTVGVRFFGTSGSRGFNHEALCQFGSFGGSDIEAWPVATDHGM